LGVRKRVLKLLRGIFTASGDHDVRVDICCKMVVLSDDQDDNVKDLAIKALTDMLYPAAVSSGTDMAGLLVDVIGKHAKNVGSLEAALKGVSVA
jgi:cohesin loading factor subunit SCC2